MIHPPPSGQLVHVSNYHVGWLFIQKWAPPCTRAGVVGKETGVRVPWVHLFSSCMSPTYVGVCERDCRDTNLDIMCRPSPCLRPVTTTPHSSSPYLSSFSLHFYIQGHYQNYNLQIYKATNTNRCNINGVCLVVLLAKEDINYPLHACGSVSIGLMCMKDKNTRQTRKQGGLQHWLRRH